MKRKAAFILLIMLILLAGRTLAAELAQGSSGKKVSSLQLRLIELELLSGEADGIYGPQTAAAVAEAQRLLQADGYAVEQTGAVDENTWALLHEPEAEEALRTLRVGSKGERVKALQNRLLDLKLFDGYADGSFGALTEAAVQKFQERMNRDSSAGIIVNGVATPEILELIQSDLSSYFSAPIYYDENEPLSLVADELYAKSCILMDAVTGETLFESNADQRMYPASTTKIMTLLLALENEELDKQVTIPSCAADVPSDSSLVPVYPGEKMKMQDLLYGLMMRSGNDAANAVAEICAGTVEQFVQKMNERAQELGMTSTFFANPHGYHDDSHVSSARDLATLARYGLTMPDFCDIVTCLSYVMPSTGKRDELLLANSYEIFDASSEYFIQGAAGVKSGYTSRAGFCYVGAAQQDERTLIAVILGVPTRNRAWIDLKRLFDYGFAL